MSATGGPRETHAPIGNRQWPRVRLGEVANVASGVTLGRRANRRETREVPYLRVANVKDGRLDLSDVYALEATEAEIEKYRLRWGDILLTEGGDPDKLGRGTSWKDQIKECIHQNHIFRVRLPAERYCPEFVSFQFGSPYGKAYFLAHAKQTTGIASINRGVVERFPLMTPALPEQQRIAARLKEQLAAVEEARARAEDQSGELDALVAAAMRESLAAERTPLMAEDILEEITRGVGARWREFPVIGATRAGWSPAKEPVGKQPERYKLVEVGSVFYNPMRIMIGSIAAVTSAEQAGITSPDYVVVRPKHGLLSPIWFYEWLRSIHGSRFINSLARGAVRERMLFSRLRKGLLAVPPLVAQERFARICSAAREAQRALSAQLTDLSALPDALLREAFEDAS